MNEQVEQFFFLIFVFVFSKNILGEGQLQPQRALAVGGIEEASFLREISLTRMACKGAGLKFKWLSILEKSNVMLSFISKRYI